MDRQLSSGAPIHGDPLPVELMNTIWADAGGIHDALATAAGLRRWLVEVGVGPVVVSQPLLEQTRALRDALRVVAAAVTDDDRAISVRTKRDVSKAVATVNALSASGAQWPAFEFRPEPAEQVTSLAPIRLRWLAELAQGAVSVLAGGELAACHAPGCVLYFTRQPPRRSWCSDTCGNRARVARHYRRHHVPGS